MSAELIIHATGLAALGLNVNGMVNRSDRQLKKSSGVAAVLWALNNLLIGATTAAALSAMSATRMTAAGYVDERNARLRALACLGFTVATLLVAALTWQGLPSVLPTTASVLVTYAVFYMGGSRLRLAMLASAVLWSYHAWSFHSLEQILANALAAAAACIGAWRTRKLE